MNTSGIISQGFIAFKSTEYQGDVKIFFHNLCFLKILFFMHSHLVLVPDNNEK